MLTLMREQGQSIYVGRFLRLDDLEGTYDYRIDFDVVDHRVGSRRVEIAIIDPRLEVANVTLTPDQPEIDFGPDKIRIALLMTHEYATSNGSAAVARIGIRAPRDLKIMRDNARAVRKVAR